MSRAPDMLRFGFAPLYLGDDDIARAVAIIADILRHQRWDPALIAAGRVT